MRFWVHPIVIAMIASGCSRPDPVEKLYGGRENVRVVASATRVEAYRVDDVASRPYAPQIAGSAILKGPIDVNASDVKALGSILTNAQTYNLDTILTCTFHPDIVFRFIRDDRKVDVVLCFTCEEFEVYDNEVKLGKEDFTAQTTSLRTIANSLFPDIRSGGGK